MLCRRTTAPAAGRRSRRLTSGQRILTQGRVIPALVTPAAGESTLKPRFRRDALPLQTSLQPHTAAGVCCILSNAFHWGKTTPKIERRSPRAARVEEFEETRNFVLPSSLLNLLRNSSAVDLSRGVAKSKKLLQQWQRKPASSLQQRLIHHSRMVAPMCTPISNLNDLIHDCWGPHESVPSNDTIRYEMLF